MFCNSGEIDDELHFITACNYHSCERDTFFRIVDPIKISGTANTFDKFVTIMNSKEPSVVKALGSLSFLVPSRNETHVWINLLIEIRFTINFIISNFYHTLSYLCPRWILHAIFFIYYDFTDILARCTIVHCFYHVCMNVCDSWVFKDAFVSIKFLTMIMDVIIYPCWDWS